MKRRIKLEIEGVNSHFAEIYDDRDTYLRALGLAMERHLLGKGAVELITAHPKGGCVGIATYKLTEI